MTVNTIASNTANNAQQVLRSNSESREVGPDHDGDADDSVGKAAAANSVPTVNVNTLGQITGGNVNTKA